MADAVAAAVAADPSLAVTPEEEPYYWSMCSGTEQIWAGRYDQVGNLYYFVAGKFESVCLFCILITMRMCRSCCARLFQFRNDFGFRPLFPISYRPIGTTMRLGMAAAT